MHRLVKIILTVKQQLLSREEKQRKLVRWLLFCAGWPELIDDCLEVATASPDSPDVLAALIEKLKEQHPDQARVQQLDQASGVPQSLKSLERFANFDNHGRLSAQDIKNLKLVAQISTLIRESVSAS